MDTIAMDIRRKLAEGGFDTKGKLVLAPAWSIALAPPSAKRSFSAMTARSPLVISIVSPELQTSAH